MTRPRLGPFELMAPLARGGMGEIWRAVHTRTGVPAAVKVLKSDAPDQAGTLEREVRAAATLCHPHIITLYDAGTVTEHAGHGLVAGSPWFAMELARGGTLSRRTADLSWTTARRVLLDLLDALAHAHARGVLHRDVKASNVLFVDEGSRLKLADFGMVYTLDSTRGPVAGGTPRYMAPEQFVSEARLQGPWTDLYAVGCLAWAMVCGRPPFTGTTVQLFHHHTMSPIPPLEPRFPVPDGLEGWIRSLMAKPILERTQRAADAANALVALADPEAAPSPLASIPPDEDERTTIVTGPLGETAPWGTQRPTAVHVPADWRAHRAGPDAPLGGTGLGLFGLRELPFVGRTAEREQLWSALRQAHQTGLAQGIQLRGGVGYGKTRLALWLARRAHEVGAGELFVAHHHREAHARDGLPGLLARALRAHRCRSEGFRDQLVQRLGEQPDWVRAALMAMCGPFLVDPPTRTPRLSGPEQYASVSRAIRALSGNRVAVVVLDDLQWASGAVDWARWVLQRQDLGPAVLIGTVQEEALADRPEQQERLDELTSQGATQLALGPMDDESRKALLRGVLTLEPGLAARIDRHAAGNPLFALQIVDDCVARGRLEERPSGFSLSHEDEALPIDVGRLWDARITALLRDRPTWQAPLELAAVLGTEVVEETWRSACARAGCEPPAALVMRLTEVRLAELGTQSGGASWRFVHGMLREAILARARDAGRIQGLHDVAASTLPTTREHAEQRAYHLALAGRTDEAIEALHQAYQYLSGHDLRRAHDLVRWREQLLGEAAANDPRRVQDLIELAYIETNTGDLARARHHATRAVALARDDENTAGALVALAVVERFEGRLESARAVMDRAAAVVAGRPLPVAADVLLEQGQIAVRLGDVAELERTVGAVLAISGHGEGHRAQALHFQVYAEMMRGDLEAAAAALGDCRSACEATGRPSMFAAADAIEAEVARARGDLERAATLYARALDTYQGVGRDTMVLTARLNLALTAVQARRPNQALQHFQQVLDHPSARTSHRILAHHGLVQVTAILGDWDRCQAHMDVLDTLPDTFIELDLFRGLCDVVRHARAGDQPALAGWALERARKQAERLGSESLQTFATLASSS